MTTSTITREADGDVTITRTDDGPPLHLAGTAQVPVVLHAAQPDGFSVGVHSDRPLDGGSFVAGLFLGALLYFIIQTAMRWHARREARTRRDAVSLGPQEDRMAADVAALARRTATLETIVTDPAHRTAREIDALR